mmetsp:Transcript_8960/g.10754  ORF Transcript_8960/g.10754 Transcript_8960/m.10754 type:complete len:2660 (-) Transcript_8960:39-8018(-)
MGQKLGKASFEDAIIPFLNLPAPAINAVWTAFNLTAEGWGLRLDVFAGISKTLASFLGADDPTMQTLSKNLFELLDTDMNGVVDALEFVCTLAMISAMEPRDKVRFVFTVYDFSEKGTLLIDEITLAIKSTVQGLCKVSKLKAPSTSDYEALSRLAFASCGKAPSESINGSYLTLTEFLAYVNSSPTTSSWMGYYDDITDTAGMAPPPPTMLTPCPDFSNYLTLNNGESNKNSKSRSQRVAWYRAPVVDESFVPEEGEENTIKYLDEGTPCYGALTELLKPDGKIKPILTVPDSQLALEWVYGISTSCRQHVHYLKDGSIVYPSGSIGITYRFPTEDGDGTATQSFFTEHGDVVSALAVSTTGGSGPNSSSLVATADSRSSSNGTPRVLLWTTNANSTNGTMTASIGGYWSCGCPPFALHFSPDGTKLLSLAVSSLPPPPPPLAISLLNKKDESSNGGDNSQNTNKVSKSYMIAVHDTKTRACLFSTVVDSYGAVYDAKWCSSISSSKFKAKGGVGGGYGGPGSSFCLATSRGVVFFSPSESGGSGASGSYEARRGVGGAKTLVEGHVSLAPLDGCEEMAAGGMSGTLFRYEGRSVAVCAKAHNSAITVVKYINASRNSGGGGNERLFTGSLDCTIKLWEPRELNQIATIDLMTLGTSLGREIISMDIRNGGAKMLVCTSGAEVWELGLSSGNPGGGDGDDDASEVMEGGGNTLGKPLHGEKPLFNGHFGESVSGLESSPISAEFASGGSDGTIRIYDSSNRSVARLQQLSVGQPITTLAYSPDGSYLLAGVGGGVDVLDPNNIGNASDRLSRLDIDAAMASMKSVKVLFIRFSPDGSIVTFLDSMGKLGVFNTGGWSLKKIHDLPTILSIKKEDISDVDISEDNQWIQVGTNNLTLYYFSLETGEIAKEGFRTVKTGGGRFPTCGPGPSKIAYEKQESHPISCNGPQDLCCVTASPSASLQLCGDKDGNIHLYHYPCLAPVVSALALVAAATAGEPPPSTSGTASGGSCWKAHTYGGVAGLCFISGDTQICSAGVKDLTIQQWKLDVNEQRNDDNAVAEAEDTGGDDDEDAPSDPVLQDLDDSILEGEDYVQGDVLGQLDQPPLFLAMKARDVGTITEITNELSTHPNGGAWHQTVPFFKNNLVSPTYPPKASTEPPNTRLEMDWVYGANIKSSLGSVRYSNEGHIIYPAASLVVVLDKGEVDTNSKKQLLISAHTEEVTTLSVHPDGDIIASGQRGPDVHVTLSSASSGRILSRLKPCLNGGGSGGNGLDSSSLAQCITAICFSPDGNLLAFSTADEDNTLHLYGTHDGELRGSAASGSDKVLCLNFSPDGSGELLQGGVDHFAVWSVRGRSLGRRRGLFGPECPKQAILACCWIPAFGDNETPIAILGAQDGNLLKLDGRTVAEVSKACKGGIGAMCAFVPKAEDGPCLCIGGRDGQVLLCGSDLTPMITINLRDKKYNCFRWAIRSVSLNKDQRKVLIGTAGNEIYEISATEEAVDMNEGALISGHCRGKLSGIASHPLNSEFATAGDDKTIRLWNSETHTLIRMLPLSQEACSCTYSPDGYLLAVGLKTGGVVIVSLLKPVLDVVKELREEGNGGQVTAVRFSHNGRVLAASYNNGADSSVVFYDCENTASPGGAFTLKSKFDLLTVTTACGHATAQAIRAETAEGDAPGGAGGEGELNLLPTEPCTMDFSSDSSVLQFSTNHGLLLVAVDTGAVIGLAAASKEALAYNDKVNNNLIDNTINKFTSMNALQAIMIAGATAFKDEKWASYTAPMGWSCQGIYSAGSTSNSIRSICRSGNNTLACSGDIYGRVNLFKWPPILPTPEVDLTTQSDNLNIISSSSSFTSLSSSNTGGDGDGDNGWLDGVGLAPCRSFQGHGGGVGGCVFIKGEESVATLGYNDRSIILWKCVKTGSNTDDDDDDDKDAKKGGNDDKNKVNDDVDEDDVDFDALEALEAAKALKAIEDEANQQAIEDAKTDPAVINDLLAKSPTNVSKMSNSHMDPSFIFGVSTFRGNMYINGDGNPLYCAGGVGIIYQRKIHSQLFCRIHSTPKPKGKGYLFPSETGGMIRVLKYCEPATGGGGNSSGQNNICCSGDALGDVVIWDSSTGAVRCVLPRGLHAQSEINTLAICGGSGNGRGGLLVTIGDDKKSMMGVWESPSGSWNNDVVLIASSSSSNSSTSKTMFVCFAEGAPFLPSEKDKVLYTYATGGKDGVQFWSIRCGNISSEKGKFIDVEPEDTCTCAVSISLPQQPQSPSSPPQIAKMTSENNLLLVENTENDSNKMKESLMIVGGASGRIMLWEGTTCNKIIKAHDSAVTDIRTVKLDVSPLAVPSPQSLYFGRVGIVSGSLDGTVKVYALMNDTTGNYLALTSSFDLSTEVIPRPMRSAVVAVAPDSNFTRLLVTTASGDVIEIVRDSRSATQLFSAHTQMLEGGDVAGGEVVVKDRNQRPSRNSTQRNSSSSPPPPVVKTINGCCVHAKHPSESDLLASGGSDGTIRMWSKSGKCVLSVLEVGSPVAALSWFIPKAVDGTANKDSGTSVDENGDAIHSLAVVLAPNGRVIQVTIDLKTMELTNSKILISSISPVPSFIVGCISGPRIFKTIARVASGRFGEIEETVKHFAMASGNSIDQNAANKATFPEKEKDTEVEVDQSGACIFLY